MNAVSLREGVELQALEIGLGNAVHRDGTDRHTRMFRDREFDICEQSLSSYIISKSRGSTFTRRCAACAGLPSTNSNRASRYSMRGFRGKSLRNSAKRR